MLQTILDKIHIRSGVLLVAIFFSVLGVYMIMNGVKDDGFIDLSSAFVSGQVKSGLVGVTFAFLSAFLCAIVVIVKPTLHTLKITQGDTTIEWSGVSNSARAMLIQHEAMWSLLASATSNKSI